MGVMKRYTHEIIWACEEIPICSQLCYFLHGRIQRLLIWVMIVEKNLYDGRRLEWLSIWLSKHCISLGSQRHQMVKMLVPLSLCRNTFACRGSWIVLRVYAELLFPGLSVNFVHEPSCGAQRLSHTTDLVRDDRAATRRANSFSSIVEGSSALFCLEPEAFGAALQEGGFRMGFDPLSGYHGSRAKALNNSIKQRIWVQGSDMVVTQMANV